MLSQDIRSRFLQYFKTQSHTIVPSSSVVPFDDPSLLFVNAGMNQFKDVFLGQSKRDYTKAVSSQKCIRVGGKHNDLENVGHTSRHLTFFEMLGNFSFGDYFKKEAIGFAWDVTTHIFDFDPEKIWVSVLNDDEEAFNLWEKHLPQKRIVGLGKRDNFWSMGEVGPCGPCSELFYDRGKKYSNASSPLKDLEGERFLEFWNLVFMQYNKNPDGSIKLLPKQSIDTGAGLERIVSLKMGVDSVFLTDILRSLIAKTENLCGKKYDPENKKLAPAFHVIADHLRTLVFAIADGVIPSNVERGYVLRKILRRAVRHGRILNLNEPFLAKLIPTLIDQMGEAYSEIKQSSHLCEEILTTEEDSFIRTLHKGNNILNDIIDHTNKTISAADAFLLKDTYGFPLEEVLLIAKDSLLNVDLEGFYKLEEKAKEKSRQKSQKTTQQIFDKNIFTDFTKTYSPSEFCGYEKEEEETIITALLLENTFVDELKEEQKGTIILKKTPFYAESGGQVGDSGELFFGENLFIVTDTQSPYPGVIAHFGFVKEGNFTKNMKVHAKINKDKRQKICNNHSATHLLQFALFQVLGDHLKQAGSVVDEKRLRFDFNHHKALSYAELKKVETLINTTIRKNFTIKAYETSFEEIKKDSSIKQLFNEKYEQKVRVIDMDISKELCGGCHAKKTGDIGLFKIAKESSIAAGVRRIEAFTGEEAEGFVYEKQEFIMYLETLLNTQEGKMPSAIETLLKDHKECLSQIKDFRKKELNLLKTELLKKVEKIKGLNFLCQKVNLSSSELVPLALELLSQIKSGIVVLGTSSQDSCQITIKISPDIIEKGILANLMVQEISPIIKGGGGGKMDLAQAGGKDPKSLEKAFQALYSFVEKKC